MKKRLKFIVSFFLILMIFVSMLYVPVSSYDNDVETSTADMLLVNLDTDTVVFSQKPDNKWYSGSLAELMTYLLAYENMTEPEKTEFPVEQAFIDELPDSDGSLDNYVDETLNAKDLMAITLLTSGSDSAYALAYLVNGSDLSGFVDMMNEKGEELGFKDTVYVSPGFSESSEQHTTCRDVFKLYNAVRSTDIFKEVMKEKKYTPNGLDEEDYTVTPEASILNSDSPYYFKYTNDAKYSYSENTYANIVLTTTYRDMTYLYVGLLGLNESEENVYADARKLITWAYLNLSDRKILNSEDAVTEVTVNSGWGEYVMPLYSLASTYKTYPKDFDEKLISFDIKVPDSVSLPVYKGQKVGKATIKYDKDKVEEIDLGVDRDEGLDMLDDCARFAAHVFDEMLVNGKHGKESGTESEGEADKGSGSESTE